MRVSNDPGAVEPVPFAAREINELLSEYLAAGTGHSPGVLTPAEARDGVAELTSSNELGRTAGELGMRCDVILYREVARVADEGLLDDARRLFEVLGRVRVGG